LRLVFSFFLSSQASSFLALEDSIFVSTFRLLLSWFMHPPHAFNMC
jgi:hypothetical protein